MARKNLIAVSDSIPKALDASEPMTASRPIAGFVPPPKRNAVPVGGITKTLGNITSKMERAQDLEKQLAEGHVVIEIDPALVDGSFVNDRLAIDVAELTQLVEQVRDHGQQVPILVRPHPDTRGRYQVAYGHRRLAAVRQLGIKVRAVVRELTDDQLVVSQGQENNARTNLSYIERALFASKLEDRAFSREIIMSALGVDKAALSRMISVVRQVSLELIEAIGAAPEVGRRRWLELAEHLGKAKVSELVAMLLTEESRSLTSDGRFQLIFESLTKKQSKPSKNVSRRSPMKTWAPEDKSVSVSVKRTQKKATIALEAADGLRFADFITGELDALYEAFRRQEKITTGD